MCRIRTSMRPPSSEGGNAICPIPPSPSGPDFNEAALKRGRKPRDQRNGTLAIRDFNEAALKRGRKRRRPIAECCWCTGTSMRPPSSEGGNSRATRGTWREANYFNEAALKRGRKHLVGRRVGDSIPVLQ